MWQKIKDNIIDTFRVWQQEFANVGMDKGVLLFFLFLPLAYPIVYSLIYNPEVVREVPIVVVDDGRTTTSREFTRMLDATAGTHVVGYAADLAEAKRAMNEKACYGILHLPESFTKDIGNSTGANVDLYCDMSLMFRYRELLMSITKTGLAFNSTIQANAINSIAPDMLSMANPIPSFTFSLGNTEEGIASFLLPGILILVLHQSIVLGIMMLGAGSRERARKNYGIDPHTRGNSATAILIGRALCYFTIYIVPTIYITHFVPYFFNFPQFGSFTDIMLFSVPFLLATIFFGMTLQPIVREREDSFPLYVVTSVALIFLSGLTWPWFAIPSFWKAVASVLPATWGVQGFIKMNGNSATLFDVASRYQILWGMVVAYAVAAWLVIRYIDPVTRRHLRRPQ